MKAKFVSVYRLVGISGLGAGVDDAEIFVSKSPLFRATIAQSAADAFDMLDRRSALAGLVMSAFTGRKDNVTAEQAYYDDLAQLKAKRSQGVFVTCDAEFEIEEIEFKTRHVIGSVGFTLDDFDKTRFRTRFDPMVSNVLTSLKLAQQNGDGDTILAGEAFCILDNAQEIYPLSLSGTARVTVASELSADALTKASKIAKNLSKSAYLRKSVDLLVGSHDTGASPLFAYISAWTALEIFVSNSFKNVYQKRWYALLEGSVPVSAKKVIEHLESVMSGKLSLGDRFAIISSILAPEQAELDTEAFSKLKDARNSFVHQPDPNKMPAGTAEIQAMLKKYLILHLE